MPPIIINANGDVRQVGSSGTGDVVGPASSTDNAIARFDSTTGKYIQDSAVIVPDTFSGNVVTENDTQTLANKTLSHPVIGSYEFDNALHSHVGSAGGGNIAGAVNAGDLITVDNAGDHIVLNVGTDQKALIANSALAIGVGYDWRVYQVYGAGASVVDPAKRIDFKDVNVVNGGSNVAEIYIDLPMICQGRLTLTSGLPVTTSDVTAAGTLYWSPYKGGKVALYDTTNSRWKLYSPGEVSGSLSGFTTSQPYDVFLYDNSGTVTMYFLAWSSATARATALTTQDGVKVLSGAGNAKYRYVGTVRMQATSQCEDSVLRRFVWNYYNRVSRKLLVTDATNSWSDTNTAWHALNSSTANRVEMVIGVSEDVVHLEHWFYASGISCYVGIALDATNANNCDIKLFHVVATSPLCAVFTKPIAEGYHYLQLTVALTSAGTATIVGDNNVPTLQQFGGVGYCVA